jgi:predicted enzyme related to lactoylglutathione lyase
MERPAHGQLGYLQIPATDIAASTAFYAELFGWEVENGAAGFTAPGLIGQFFTEHAPTPGAGPLLWIMVDDMDAALAAAAENGGEVRSPPEADGPHRTLATISDPAGNTLGLVALSH